MVGHTNVETLGHPHLHSGGKRHRRVALPFGSYTLIWSFVRRILGWRFASPAIQPGKSVGGGEECLEELWTGGSEKLYRGMSLSLPPQMSSKLVYLPGVDVKGTYDRAH